MPSAQRHMVRRGVLEVELTGTETDGLRLQQDLLNLCRDRLARALAEAFGDTAPEDELWFIDRMDVDLGPFPLDRLEHDFVDAVTQAVGRQIRERATGLGGRPGTGGSAPGASSPTDEPFEPGAPASDPATAIRRRTTTEAAYEAFVYFLATGALPWWLRLQEGTTFEAAITASWPGGKPPAAYSRAVTDPAASPVLRARLVRQFSTHFVETLLESASPEDAKTVRQILEQAVSTDAADNNRLADLIHPESLETPLLATPPAEVAYEAFVHFLATGALPRWLRLQEGTTFEATITASWPGGKPPAAYSRAVTDPAAPALHARLVRQFSTHFVETLLENTSPEDASTVRQILEQQAVSTDAADKNSLADQIHPESLETSSSQATPPAEVAYEAFVHFLATGALPRWLRLQEGTTFEATITASWPGGKPPAAYSRAVTDPAALRARLVRQFSAHFVEALLENASPEDAKTTLRQILEQQAASAGATDKNSLAKPRRLAATAASLDLDEGLYVECAGLVLLHPFLPRLFDALGFAVDGTLIRPDRALPVLHFLATGERLAPEHALVLPKTLCGLPLETLAAAPAPLTPEEEDEATALLEAVIGHWEMLGSTSVDALRGTFLVRPGKLSRREEDLLLQVEPQSFDILLDRLPWGIGAIQLPWMNRMLWVEWTP